MYSYITILLPVWGLFPVATRNGVLEYARLPHCTTAKMSLACESHVVNLKKRHLTVKLHANLCSIPLINKPSQTWATQLLVKS